MCAEPLLFPGLAGVPTDRSGGIRVEINHCAVTGKDTGMTSACMFWSDLDIGNLLCAVQSQS